MKDEDAMAEHNQPPPVIVNYQSPREWPRRAYHWLIGAVLGLTASVLGSSLLSMFVCVGHSSPLAKRVSCASNLNGIGKAVLLYRQDSHDADPPDQVILAKSGYIPLGAFICPSTETPRVPSPSRTITQADLEGHCDYVLITGLGSTAPDDLALAFELPANERQQGAQTALQSVSVRWMDDLDEWRFTLQRTNDALAVRRRSLP